MPRYKKIKISEIRSIAALQCSTREAAAFFGIRHSLFKHILDTDPVAKDAWEDGQGKGKMLIRQRQMKLSENSASMAIWLGKQYLGQKDVVVQEISGPDGGPVKTLSVEKLNEEERNLLRELIIKSRPGSNSRGPGSSGQ